MKPSPVNIQFFFFLAILAAGCSPSGPPFPGLSTGEPLPANLVARRYVLNLPLTFYRSSQRAELVFDQDSKGGSHFAMRIAGRNPIESIRIRSYEGTAHRFADSIELRSNRCYIQGKKEWEDRLVPLEGWDCEHLIFQMVLLGSDLETLQSVPTDHTVSANWFGDFTALAMPKSTFAGQIIASLDDERVVIWGRDGGVILRDGQILEGYQMDLQGLGQTRNLPRPAGTFKVISRPGDFIIARRETRSTIEANVALTQAPKPGAGSIF
ncbi:MAG: hypothetical protein K8S54_09870 [Spirochaetia bacterium]|nr:hypothetical protein [Spirochaetia bacterium]